MSYVSLANPSQGCCRSCGAFESLTDGYCSRCWRVVSKEREELQRASELAKKIAEAARIEKIKHCKHSWEFKESFGPVFLSAVYDCPKCSAQFPYDKPRIKWSVKHWFYSARISVFYWRWRNR